MIAAMVFAAALAQSECSQAWTIGPGGETLRNGVHADGGYGIEYRCVDGVVYVWSDPSWWMFDGAHWQGPMWADPGGQPPPWDTQSPDTRQYAAAGQPYRVAALHDGGAAIGYRLFVDGHIVADMPRSAVLSDGLVIFAGIVFEVGERVVWIQAYSEDIVSSSDGLILQVLAVEHPHIPSGLRVITIGGSL